MPTVLVVDDQFLIRSGLVALLRAAPGIEVIGEAQDGEEAIEIATRTRPDVILMDIRMPGHQRDHRRRAHPGPGCVPSPQDPRPDHLRP